MKITVAELRERAGRILAGADLLDVRLSSAMAQSANPLLEGPFQVDSQVQTRSEVPDDEGLIYTFLRYNVRAVTESNEDAEAWQVDARFVATYKRTTTEDLDPDDLTCFALAIGLMTVHPYAREAIQSLVSRMGYPPFTLGMMAPLTGGADSDLVELNED